INGELWGRALPVAQQADPPAWSVKYPEEIYQQAFQSDAERTAQLIDNLSAIPGGKLMAPQDLVDMARGGNAEIIEAMRPVLTAYYPSQLFQAFSDGPILALVLILVWLKPRRPGVVGCWFLIAYGVLRITTEFFRQPDDGIPLLLGLSRGQVLSILMIVTGLVILRIVSKRDVQPMGGLLRPK
ncbi:MAG: prolipoprotein diacylglyceryl transferase, partial [Planctomycetota bacterium]|nr:prolipoprotein diacylglyceryl transferase [Planctomycetota bacterium]